MTKEDKATLTKYIEDKDYASVIDYCSSKIELDKSDHLFFGTRGCAYIEIEEYDKAITDLTQSIELNSEYAQGWFNRGRCYYYKNDDKLALADFKKSLFIESTPPRFRTRGTWFSVCNAKNMAQ